MSWATDKATITTILTGISYAYTELQGNLDLMNEMPSALINKGFTLKPIDSDTRALTASQTLVATVAQLQISYATVSNSAFDTAYDSFLTVLNAIASYHSGFYEPPTFERHPQNNKYAIGTARFFLGVQSC